MKLKWIAVLMLAVLAVSCAVNPVTGHRELSLISESQEIEMGRQTDIEVLGQYGLYSDPALSAYVGKMGLALAAKSQRPGLPWRFSVLDSPVINAFAVPGGSVYVTRGILALMTSEAELAGVLGHEIGHVNARHSVRQMNQQILAQVGLAVGSAVSRTFAKYSGAAGVGLQVLFLKYSRDDERQADALGVGYSRLGGYDPGDIAVFFEALDRSGDHSAGKSLPGFLSTHPLTSERIQNVKAMLKPEDKALARRPEPYLRSVDNIVYGEDPRQGFVEGSTLYHPGLRCAFVVPAGWQVENTPAHVTLATADGKAGVLLLAEKSVEGPEGYARKKAAEITGGKLLAEGGTTINGLAGYEQTYNVTAENQAAVQMRRSYLKKGEHVFTFSALSAATDFAKYESEFRRVVGSFRELTDPSLLNRQPKRLALVKAWGKDTLQDIFRKAGLAENLRSQFAVLNGLDLTAVPPAGTLIKVLK
jgi:predicted Zn-dependent protease